MVRDDLHPALAYLLLEAARQVHRLPSLINRPDEFPEPERRPTSRWPTEAERYFKNGRPFLQNYLPFWMANLVQRLVLLLVPLAAILIPLVRLLPGLDRLAAPEARPVPPLRRAEVPRAGPGGAHARRRRAARGPCQLDRIENEIVQAKFPLDFSDRVYTLRQHVDYVRAQLDKEVERTPAQVARSH